MILMNIEISVKSVGEGELGSHSLPSGAQIIDLLEQLDRNPETVVVKRNEKVVPEEEELEDGDEIEVIPVVSGG